jgi:hypothetical protein
MTKGERQRTHCKVMGQWTTQQEARVDSMGQLDKAGVDNVGQSDSGQRKEWRRVEDLT